MDDALFMGGLESFGDLERDRKRLIDVEPWRFRIRSAFGDPFRKRRSLNQLHDDRAHFRLPCSCWRKLLDTVNVRDVWMVDRSEYLRLAVEARDALGIVGDRIWQDLDRNVP